MSDERPSKQSLDELLASVPRDVRPGRDLWPGIRAEIAKTPIVTDAAPESRGTPSGGRFFARALSPVSRGISSGQRFSASARPSVVHLTSSRWFQIAAGLLLLLATSFTTFVITRQVMEKDAAMQVAQQPLPAPALNAMPVSFGPEMLGAEYLQVRSELNQRFEERLKTLPPATRDKLERNLADLRKAANEISTTLAEHPSDPLLQDLLMSTYQRELQLLADVSDVPLQASTRTDL